MDVLFIIYQSQIVIGLFLEIIKTVIWYIIYASLESENKEVQLPRSKKQFMA